MKKITITFQAANGGGIVPADTLRQILGRPVEIGRDLPYAQLAVVMDNNAITRCVFFPDGSLFLSSGLDGTTDVILAIFTLPA